MKKLLIIFIVSFVTFGNIAFADEATDGAPASQPAPEVAPQGILPSIPAGTDCKQVMQEFRKWSKSSQIEMLRSTSMREEILGCAIKTGKVTLFMLPFFIVSLIQFLIGLAGLICVLFIVIGGYKYITGGITDDKESGKKTIMYAIIGLVVALISWIVINVIQVQLTR